MDIRVLCALGRTRLWVLCVVMLQGCAGRMIADVRLCPGVLALVTQICVFHVHIFECVRVEWSFTPTAFQTRIEQPQVCMLVQDTGEPTRRVYVPVCVECWPHAMPEAPQPTALLLLHGLHAVLVARGRAFCCRSTPAAGCDCGAGLPCTICDRQALHQFFKPAELLCCICTTVGVCSAPARVARATAGPSTTATVVIQTPQLF